MDTPFVETLLVLPEKNAKTLACRGLRVGPSKRGSAENVLRVDFIEGGGGGVKDA